MTIYVNCWPLPSFFFETTHADDLFFTRLNCVASLRAEQLEVVVDFCYRGSLVEGDFTTFI